MLIGGYTLDEGFLNTTRVLPLPPYSKCSTVIPPFPAGMEGSPHGRLPREVSAIWRNTTVLNCGRGDWGLGDLGYDCYSIIDIFKNLRWQHAGVSLPYGWPGPISFTMTTLLDESILLVGGFTYSGISSNKSSSKTYLFTRIV